MWTCLGSTSSATFDVAFLQVLHTRYTAIVVSLDFIFVRIECSYLAAVLTVSSEDLVGTKNDDRQAGELAGHTDDTWLEKVRA